MSTIGDRIRERRKRVGISQAELAFLLQIGQKQISRYESGENDPSSHVLVLLAQALDTTPDFLCGFSSIFRADELSIVELKLLRAYRRKNMRALLELIMPLACNGVDTDE